MDLLASNGLDLARRRATVGHYVTLSANVKRAAPGTSTGFPGHELEGYVTVYLAGQQAMGLRETVARDDRKIDRTDIQRIPAAAGP